MKKLILYILPIFLLFSSSGILIAQDDIKSEKAAKAKQKKEARKKQAEEILSLVQEQDFVLEAYSLL